MNKLLLTFFILTSVAFSALAQKPMSKILKGKVTADAYELEDIYVINTKTENSTKTISGGYFSIAVTVGDTLMLSSTQFKGVRLAITQAELDKDLLFVKMQPTMTQLAEVVIHQYKNINAVDLGIIPKGQKSYTVAERRLRTATGLDARIGLNTSLSIDPLLNLFSGRTAELLKNIEVERKEILLKKIKYSFENDFFVDKLKIPSEYVKGFQYYIVENNRFVQMMNSKNKEMTTFLLGELATQYLQLIRSEKK